MCGAPAGKYLAALLVMVVALSKCCGKGMLLGGWVNGKRLPPYPGVAT